MKGRHAYGIILLFTCVNNITTNLVHPVTPTFLTQLQFADQMFGVLFAAMAVGMLFSSAYWGRFADRHDRWTVFALGSLIYLIGQTIFLCGGAEIPLVIGRLVGGLGCSAPTIALMTTVIDLSDDTNRATHLSVFAAASCGATAAGFFIGGLIGVNDPAISFKVQICLLALLTVCAYFFYPRVPHAASVGGARRLSWRESREILTPSLLLFLGCVAMCMMGSYGYDNAFNYFIKREFDFPSSYNGVIKALNGLLGFAGSLLVNPLLVKRFRLSRALTVVLIACAVTLLLVTGTVNVPLFIALNVLFYVFNTMYQPLLQTQLMNVSQADAGLLSGMYNTAKSVGMIIGSLAAGGLYAMTPRAPFIMQMLCFAVAAAMSVALVRLPLRSTSARR